MSVPAPAGVETRPTGGVAALVILVATHVRLRVRDRTLVGYGLVVPMALAVLFGSLLGGATSIEVTVGIVGAAPPTTGPGGTDRPSGEPAGVRITPVSDVETALAALDARDLDAVIVLGGGDDGDADGAEVRVLTREGSDLAASIATAVARRAANEALAPRLAARAAVVAGVPADRAAAAAAAAPPAVVAREGRVPEEHLDTRTYFAAGMAAFFVMFTVHQGVGGLLEDRRRGTLWRHVGAPVPRWVVVAAPLVVGLVLRAASVVSLLAASTVVMDARFGSLTGVGLLTGSLLIAVTGITAVVAGLARTPEAAGTWQSVLAVTLGVAGGVFVPVDRTSTVLAALPRLTPHWWYLRGMGRVAAGGGPGAVAGPALGLAGIGVVASLVAIPLLVRSLRP